MKLIIFITVTVAVSKVFCYHDPDLNYHLSQVQKLSNCDDNGYAYPAPALQLSTNGVKIGAHGLLTQQVSAPAGYSASTGYSNGLAYQALAPKIEYAAQPAATYQSSYSSATNDAHGYATSAGLSSATSPRPITPIATYAQAPIIAKVTGSPIFAKFAVAPAKTTYVAQNSVSQQGVYSTGSLAKASLNSYSNIHAGSPVVSQVYAAPTVRYTASPALRVQPQQPIAYNVVSPGVQYSQAANIAQAAQYARSSFSQVSAPATSYFTPSAQKVTQYAAPVAQYAAPVAQYAAPVAQYAAPVAQYAAPVAQYAQTVQYAPAVAAAPTSTHYSAPAVAQYSAPAAQYSTSSVSHYSAPSAVTQYAAPAVVQYSAPAGHYAGQSVAHYAAPSVTRHSSPAVATVSQYAAPSAATHVSAPVASVTHHGVAAFGAKLAAPGFAVKNVHTDFLENYDAHPRYAFEYGVNDPHTGDIKQQKEERDGEVVKGQYSLVEPDGSVRTVNYVADWDTGFHADVRNSKDTQH